MNGYIFTPTIKKIVRINKIKEICSDSYRPVARISKGGGALFGEKVDLKPKGGGGLIWEKRGPLYYTLWSLWPNGGGGGVEPPTPPLAMGLFIKGSDYFLEVNLAIRFIISQRPLLQCLATVSQEIEDIPQDYIFFCNSQGKLEVSLHRGGFSRMTVHPSSGIKVFAITPTGRRHYLTKFLK